MPEVDISPVIGNSRAGIRDPGKIWQLVLPILGNKQAIKDSLSLSSTILVDALLAAFNTKVPDTRASASPECQSDIIKQMKAAWSLSNNGQGMRRVLCFTEPPTNYSIGAISYSNKQYSVTLPPASGAFAIMHTHPNTGVPTPSDDDVIAAKANNVLM